MEMKDQRKAEEIDDIRVGASITVKYNPNNVTEMLLVKQPE